MKNSYFKKLLKGDIATLAQSITLIESSLYLDKKKANDLIDKCLKIKNDSFRIAVSGIPGVGKSTFINALLKNLINLNKKVAILTIDPSSSKSKGSILADKTRMTNVSGNKNIFIRPSPSKGKLGGISNKTRQSIILCETAGFDIIIIETTGVGQTEMTAKEMTDFFILLTMPNSGDQLQAIKKGIVEIADLIVINKIDTLTELNILKEKNYYSQIKNTKKHNYQKIQTCSSKKGIGLDNICSILTNNYTLQKQTGKLDKNRINQIKYWLNESIQEILLEKFYSQKKIQKEILKITKEIKEKNVNVDKLSKKLVDKYLK